MDERQQEGPPAVIAALRREIAPLLARAREPRREADGGLAPTLRGERVRAAEADGGLRGVVGRWRSPARFYRVRLGGREAIVGWTGDGARCARALEALFARVVPARILFVGVAGGLSPGLARGALLAAREVRDEQGAAPPPEPARVGRGDAEPAMIYTSARIVSTAEEKARLWRSLGAPEPAAVDLESAAWARAAAAAGVGYALLRVVIDPAEEDLPLDFEACRGADGRVRTSRVALAALGRPAAVAALRRLERRLERCAERLASAAEEFIACGPP